MQGKCHHMQKAFLVDPEELGTSDMPRIIPPPKPTYQVYTEGIRVETRLLSVIHARFCRIERYG